MVELTMESLSQTGMPQECFVSMRVGETQKLTRLSEKRTFRFPRSDKRFGKIEVFRRIGACSVDVDPSREGARELNVDCSDAGFGMLGLKVGLGGEALKQVVETNPAKPAAKPPGTKERVAKDYLARHNLEVHLSDAMQAVLRERPDNPLEFLSARLTRIQGIQPIVSDSSPQPVASRKQQPVVVPEVPHSAAQQQSVASQPAPPALLPFASYCQAHLPKAGSCDDAFTRLHASFGGPKKGGVADSAVKPLQSQQSIAKDFGAGYYRSNFRGCGTDAFSNLYGQFGSGRAQAQHAQLQSTQPQQDIAKDFGSKYCRDNICPCCEDAFAALYGQFGVPSRAAVKAQPEAWHSKPSVGTWATPLCKEAPIEAPASQWFAKPSVGTWVLPSPGAQDPQQQEAQEEPIAKWHSKPSVGTWAMPLNRLPIAKETPPPLFSRPSVGTWLLPPGRPRCVVQGEKNTSAARKKALILPHSMTYGPSLYSVNVRPSCTFRVL